MKNNIIIEIDNCSPLEILKLQQLYEELETCGERLMGYKECFEIMGKERGDFGRSNRRQRLLQRENA